MVPECKILVFKIQGSSDDLNPSITLLLTSVHVFTCRLVHLAQGGGSVISGLKEVLVGMQPGGKRRALIPPSEGYLNEGMEPQVCPDPHCQMHHVSGHIGSSPGGGPGAVMRSD